MLIFHNDITFILQLEIPHHVILKVTIRSLFIKCYKLYKLGTGDIILFVPRDFSGAIQLSSHKGRIEFLPAFASQMQVMKQSQKDALVMLGNQTMGETRDINFCELMTRSGMVVIGVRDIDRYNSTPGFWQRLCGRF
ncbi:hypothetical protein J132_08996 [Termitomyces sp. J132]|nr:hypothetical protein J132_08996 [Termitomyces sp. J132]